LSLSSASPADQATLVVPVDIAALCVGIDDAQQATGRFAGATAVYTHQATNEHNAYLGDNVTRPYSFPPWDQLQQGVHLHWALPDALTRGGGPGAELEFPPVPNRWLVTRIEMTGGAAVSRSWLIESDALSAARPPAPVSAVTLPVRQDTPRAPDYAFLGRSYPVSDGWSGEPAPAGPRITEAAGTPLNAVCNGEVGFAAYYPSCRGVFGFRDALEDLSPPAADPAQLTYAVTGWYADPAQDPVRSGATPAQAQEALGWTFEPAAQPPSRSVYSGVLEGISWSPQRAYILGQPVQRPVEVGAAIGNTASEALAAYFMARDHPGEPLFETMLDAFASGLLETFKQPEPDGLATILERLHAQRFGGSQAGTVFSIVAAGAEGPESGQLTGLPEPLADDLERLNLARQLADQYGFHADWYRWQLFADWYRIFMTSDPTRAVAVAMQRYGNWETLARRRDGAGVAAAEQERAVIAQLGEGDMELRAGPAEGFAEPAEPVVVISSPDLRFPVRYGGDGRFSEDGYLICRTGDRLLTAVTAGGTAVTAASMTGVTVPAALPGAGLLTDLCREACLLWPALLARLTGVAADALRDAFSLALEGKPQGTCTLAGAPPSPVEVSWWEAGRFMPVFATWTVQYLPLQPTRSGQTSLRYEPPVVTANFTIDVSAGGAMRYTPSGRPGTIRINPASGSFPQAYTGDANLSPTPAQALATALEEYLADHPDATLRAVLEELTSGAGFLTLPLNGLAEALRMQQFGVQLQVKVPTTSPFGDLTTEIAPIIGDAPMAGGPDFNGYFNPLRAGYLRLGLTLVDVFGQKREVTIPTLTCSNSMTAAEDGKTVPSVAYLEPRIAQPSRLVFRWLAAEAGAEEMTGNPAVSPVCGWLLPNYVDGSLAIYDPQGRPLGTLYRIHDGPAAPVGWQSAPGDAKTIDQDLATVMAYTNPRLRDVALALSASSETFAAMWRLLDTVGETIQPGPLPTDSSLAVLAGRPVAVVQAALRLELQGAAMLNLGWDVEGTDTDSGLAGVRFPVVLGDTDRLRDGLIGYFKQTAPGQGYDMSTFYSQGADPGAVSGIARPAQENICVTPVPPVTLDGAVPSDLERYTQRVLMLVDPLAQVHATTGALPSAALDLTAGLAQASLSTLSVFLFTAPVLRGAGALALPVPDVGGYALSYVSQDRDRDGTPSWHVTPDIETPPDGVWGYTPQVMLEGWLRLNAVTLELALTDTAGQPTVRPGRANDLTLTVTNRARQDVTFRRGAPVAEGVPPPGSVFYVHFGTLVAAPAVEHITLTAPGWSFRSHATPEYGAYWAASPTADVTLGEAAALVIAVSGLVPARAGGQARVFFDYYAIDGISDGVYADVLTVQADPASPDTD
jgi:hypothetical protein